MEITIQGEIERMYSIKQTSFNSGKAEVPFGKMTNESGSAIFIVVVAMAILTIIGGISIKSSRDEIKIAGNDRRYQITKTEADGAIELGSELLEQNIACATGFTTLIRGGLVNVVTPAFWQNDRDFVTTPDSADTDRDFYFPNGYTAGDPHTNYTLGGFTQFAHGAAIQMAAGYEGKGKGAGSAGGVRIYEIFTQRKGELDSEAICKIEWRHVIGTEDACID